MRFDKIETFSVEDLSLDEGNYRFISAKNQADCIEKINSTNPAYFKGLIESIGEDDLGEPLLVYKEGNKNIVLDGNRRLAALKCLFDDNFLPSPSLKPFVDNLRKNNKISFSEIQAQVSSDKKLIMRTVYERHASGKTGKSRISWNAYAAARFGYDEKIGDNKEWKFIAILSETALKDTIVSAYIESNKFGFETYRRLMREAFKRGLISDDIFSERNLSIKATANKKSKADAITKTKKILKAMKDGKISLSRKGNFADKAAVEKFFDDFNPTPEAQKAADAKNSSPNNLTENNNVGQAEYKNTEKLINEQEEQLANEGNDTESVNSADKPTLQIGIIKSLEINNKLQSLKSKKLTSLYSSLCKVSLDKNPVLMYVGAWSFFEVLSKLAGNTKHNTKNTEDFPAYFRHRMKAWAFDANQISDSGSILDIVSKYGNMAKHAKNASPISANQLRQDFEDLEKLILAALDEAISKKKA